MTQEITDFTKPRLTQAFEAKGNAGSSLTETIQPVVLLHDLEHGAFPPFNPFSWFADCAAVAAAIPAAILGTNALLPMTAPIEQTVIIDLVILSSPSAQLVNIAQGAAQSITTPQGPRNPVSNDMRLGVGADHNQAISTLRADFGTGLSGGTNARIARVALAANAVVQVPLRVIMAAHESITQANPELIIFGETVNVPLDISLHGRLFPVQS